MFKHEILAKNIKKYRIKNGMTQADLADNLFVSEQAVSKWECGISVPELSKLCGIGDILNVSVDILLNEIDVDVNMKIMLGIDGRGAKTEFLLFYEDGSIIRRFVLEGSNPNAYGMEKTIEVLKTGIDLMFAQKMRIDGIFAGISGCGEENNAQEIYDFLSKRYPDSKIKCTSDVFNVIASATDQKQAIAVICGTGSSIFVKNDNEISRVGGWGYLLGDACSAHSIGREALRACLAEEDGIGRKTLISDGVYKRMGNKELFRNLSEIYKKEKSFIGEFAPVVLEAYHKNDEVAKEIIEKESDELARMINFAYKRYDCTNVLILSGSMFENTSIIYDFIIKKIDPSLKVIIPQVPQIYGACRQCMNLVGIDDENSGEKLIKEYNNYIK